MSAQRKNTSCRCSPAIQLCSTQHHNPIVPRRVVRNQLLEDVAAHWAGAQNGEEFQGDHSGVRHSPSEVGSGILSPCIDWLRYASSGKKRKTYTSPQRARRSCLPGVPGRKDIAKSLQRRSVSLHRTPAIKLENERRKNKDRGDARAT